MHATPRSSSAHAALRILTTSVALATVAMPTSAQESRSPYDAATLQFPDSTSIVRTAEFNDDGQVDAVGLYWSNSSESTIRLSTYLGAGDGSFSEVSSNYFSADSLIWALETGRLNSDTRDDIAVAVRSDWQESTIRILEAGPTGAMVVATTWVEPMLVTSMVIADFDEDGLNDIAIAGQGVKLYRNTGTGFALSSTLPTGEHIRSGDFDGSGGPDLLVVSGPSLEIASCTNAIMTTGATFHHGVQAWHGPHPVAGDIDGDGDDDIVMFSDSGDCIVLRRTSSTTFSQEAKTVGGPATDLVDLDGDGDLDGACCGGGGGPTPAHNTMPSTFRVSINDGNGNFGTAHDLIGRGAFRLGGAVDVDGDGDLDLVAGRAVIFNRGYGFAYEPQPTGVSGNKLIDATDVEQDGDPDFQAHYTWASSLTTSKNDGTGRSIPVSTKLPHAPNTLLAGPSVAGDFDGDGDVDLIVYHWVNSNSFIGMRLYKNTGGSYEDAGLCTPNGTPFQTGGLYNKTIGPNLAADLDADGDIDVFAGRASSGLGAIWWNDGSGFFNKGAQGTYFNKATHAIDLDHDGFLDLTNGASVWYGSGIGQFGAVAAVGPSIYPFQDRAEIVDLNGDGLLDIVGWGHNGANDLEVFLQTSPRVFQEYWYDIDSPYYLGGTDNRRVFTDDLDGDGDVDVLVTPILNNSKVGRIFWNDGQGQFPESIDQMVGLPNGIADVDGDGDLDLIGERLIRNATHDPSTAGLRRQYGSSKAGLGGIEPTLGASGSFTANGNIEIRLTGGRGGSVALFVVGLAESAVPNWPAFGSTAYTFPAPIAIVLPLSGHPNVAGTGDLTLPIVVPPAASGFPFFHQAFIHDPASVPGIFSHTNGLELRYP